jgi:hypothetical protein
MLPSGLAAPVIGWEVISRTSSAIAAGQCLNACKAKPPVQEVGVSVTLKVAPPPGVSATLTLPL